MLATWRSGEGVGERDSAEGVGVREEWGCDMEGSECALNVKAGGDPC